MEAILLWPYYSTTMALLLNTTMALLLTNYCLLRLDATELRVDETLLKVRARGRARVGIRVRVRVRVRHVLVG